MVKLTEDMLHPSIVGALQLEHGYSLLLGTRLRAVAQTPPQTRLWVVGTHKILVLLHACAVCLKAAGENGTLSHHFQTAYRLFHGAMGHRRWVGGNLEDTEAPD